MTDSGGTRIKPARFNTKTNRKQFSFQLKQKWTVALGKAFFPERQGVRCVEARAGQGPAGWPGVASLSGPRREIDRYVEVPDPFRANTLKVLPWQFAAPEMGVFEPT